MADFGPLVVASELEGMLGRDDLCLLDCRFDLKNPNAGRAAHSTACIPGARYVDLDRDLAAPIRADSGRHPLPAVEDLNATFGRAGVDDSMRVVVYDDAAGAFAARCWWLLRWLGHDRVAVLDGGIDGWVDAGGRLEAGELAHEAREFSGVGDPDAIMTTARIVTAIANGEDFTLVDARDGARFRGEVEPIDAVAGHVPGALNLPFSDTLDKNGRWRSRDELAAILASKLDAGEWTVMCGSGVTACHLAVAAELAGYPEPRLYVGSWSEWIRDPSRDVASGP